MYELNERIEARLQLVDPTTGELFNVVGSRNVNEKYYSISKLNKRICVMDLFTYQSQICKGKVSILIFRDILLETDKHNEFRANVTKFAKKNQYSRSQVTDMLRQMVTVGFAIKLERGVYMINPMAFQSVGSNNKLIEQAQHVWSNSGSE